MKVEVFTIGISVYSMLAPAKPMCIILAASSGQLPGQTTSEPTSLSARYALKTSTKSFRSGIRAASEFFVYEEEASRKRI